MLNLNLVNETAEEIEALRKALYGARATLDGSHPRFQSLLNLEHYLILRSQNRTELQEKLFLLSLSSLGRSTAHVAASIDTLYDQLCSAMDVDVIAPELMEGFQHASIADAIALASQNASALLGGTPQAKLSRQKTHVMVTLPSHATDNEGKLIRDLAAAGVQLFRINTAHDDFQTWQSMAAVIQQINAGRKDEEALKIYVDLAGPKIRTGEIRKCKLPVAIGSNKHEKEVLIVPESEQTRGEQKDAITLQKLPARISVAQWFFKKLKADKKLQIFDSNFKKATIRIVEVSEEYARGIIDKKVFIDENSILQRKHYETHVLNVMHQTDPIRLFIGDTLILSDKEILGHAAITEKSGTLVSPATIGCTLEHLDTLLQPGDPIFIDDGKIALEVERIEDHKAYCRVTSAKIGGTLLKEEKGINLPQSHIDTPALTDDDRALLEGISAFADILGLSFCQNAKDVKALQNELEQLGRSDIGIVAKIETKHAIANMPEILRALLDWEKSGVMIARGDLAIEVGFANLPSIQEKLLDICDAAHVPVIWATQVLESKMKTNLPSRAEVTDAAMASRAECVMLNKGMFAVDTIDTLRHILHEMHDMFRKNRQLLRKETLWNT